MEFYLCLVINFQLDKFFFFVQALILIKYYSGVNFLVDSQLIVKLN
jgi:hypothetical protein